MTKFNFDENASIEKRVKYIETILRRLARRVHKKTSVMLSPVPMSAYMTGENLSGLTLYKSLMFKGKLIKGFVEFGVKPKDEVMLHISVIGVNHADSYSFKTNRKRIGADLNIPVDNGSTLSFSVEASNPEEVIREVSVTVLWTPDISNAEVKSFAIEELEKTADANLLEE